MAEFGPFGGGVLPLPRSQYVQFLLLAEHLRRLDRTSDSRAPQSFVPVRVVPDTIVEVIFPAGWQLRVPLAADAGQVARLVHALGARPC